MHELKATIREAGKKLGTMRKAGGIPAILYGPGVDALPLQVGRGDFDRAFAEVGESSLLRLVVEQGREAKPYVVLIRDVQRDPLRDAPVHLDFHAVKLDEEIKIAVLLNFMGQPPVEARGEGVVVKDLHEIEVAALPEKLPHEINVDLSGFTAIDAEIRVADLLFPEGVRAVSNSDLVVAHATPLMSEEEIAKIEASAEEAAAIESIEVVGKKEEKAEEGEGEEGAGEGVDAQGSKA